MRSCASMSPRRGCGRISRRCSGARRLRRSPAYELPQLGALNFVMVGALAGGVTRSLSLDAHGKCLGSVLLELDLPDA